MNENERPFHGRCSLNAPDGFKFGEGTDWNAARAEMSARHQSVRAKIDGLAAEGDTTRLAKLRQWYADERQVARWMVNEWANHPGGLAWKKQCEGHEDGVCRFLLLSRLQLLGRPSKREPMRGVTHQDASMLTGGQRVVSVLAIKQRLELNKDESLTLNNVVRGWKAVGQFFADRAEVLRRQFFSLWDSRWDCTMFTIPGRRTHPAVVPNPPAERQAKANFEAKQQARKRNPPVIINEPDVDERDGHVSIAPTNSGFSDSTHVVINPASGLPMIGGGYGGIDVGGNTFGSNGI